MFKDTKEGETHSYNDGCGEPAHNPKLPKHIEESFDTLFNSLGYDHVDTCTCGFMEDCKCISGRDKLKSFIATILEEATRKAVGDTPHSKDEKHVCCDDECNHDSCCGKVSENCPRNFCNHIMVDTGKYERQCKFCRLSELRANYYGNKNY